MGDVPDSDLDHRLALVLVLSSVGTHSHNVLPCQSGKLVPVGLQFRYQLADAGPFTRYCESMVVEAGDFVGLCSAIVRVIFGHEVDHPLDAGRV